MDVYVCMYVSFTLCLTAYIRFQLADGRTMCIGEYFEKEKQYKLRFPGLPCVHVGPREKDIIVPMEVRLSLTSENYGVLLTIFKLLYSNVISLLFFFFFLIISFVF